MKASLIDNISMIFIYWPPTASYVWKKYSWVDIRYAVKNKINQIWLCRHCMLSQSVHRLQRSVFTCWLAGAFFHWDCTAKLDFRLGVVEDLLEYPDGVWAVQEVTVIHVLLSWSTHSTHTHSGSEITRQQQVKGEIKYITDTLHATASQRRNQINHW